MFSEYKNTISSEIIPYIFKKTQRIQGQYKRSLKILPVTSCCPASPTGTIPRLFIAVAQAVGSVTDMLSCVVSIAILPKPSAAARKETRSK